MINSSKLLCFAIRLSNALGIKYSFLLQKEENPRCLLLYHDVDVIQSVWIRTRKQESNYCSCYLVGVERKSIEATLGMRCCLAWRVPLFS